MNIIFGSEYSLKSSFNRLKFTRSENFTIFTFRIIPKTMNMPEGVGIPINLTFPVEWEKKHRSIDYDYSDQ